MLGAVVVVLAVSGLIGLVVVVIRRTNQAAQARVAALQDVADRLSWRFGEEVAFNAIPNLDRFELFRQGSSRRLKNLMTSPPGDPRAVLFDYSYVISTGKSQHTHSQTVFYATGERLALPSFSVRPENFFHRVGRMFGYQDIDIDRRPTFSEQFLLRGTDEAAVRAVFSDDVAAFFEARPGVCAAATGRELLYWRPGRLATPADIDPFIAEGFELAELFATIEPRS